MLALLGKIKILSDVEIIVYTLKSLLKGKATWKIIEQCLHIHALGPSSSTPRYTPRETYACVQQRNAFKWSAQHCF